jgi:hypothetical protein
MIIFFNGKYVVQWEFFPDGKTVNAVFYNDVKERLLKMNEISEVSWAIQKVGYCYTMHHFMKLRLEAISG